MEHNTFASLAHFRILLIPVGSISRGTFDQWAAEIRTLENIRLSDIPPGTKDEKARFMPSPKSKGYLRLCFPTHPPPSLHYAMSLFRPSHFSLGVIGIASCSQKDSISSITAEFNAAVKDLFPPDSIYPLAKSCFVFEENDGTTNLNLGDHLPGLVIIPSMMGNKKENIETLLADLCSNILAEFSTIFTTLESSLGNEYLNASLFPSLPSLADFPQPLVDDEPESLLRLSSHNSQPELSPGPLRRGSTPILGMKRNASAGAGSPMASVRQNTLNVPITRKRQSLIGATSSHGRLFKVLGDFFMLAGRTEDASVWYAEAVALFKTATDPVWYASALEGLATVALLEAWSGQGFQTSISASREPWSDISEKLDQAISLYSRPGPLSESDQRYDLLAYLYTVAILRLCFLLFATWAAKGWGPLAFTALMHPGPAPYVPPTLSHPDSHLPGNRDRLSSISGITRSQMASVIAQAHGPWLLHLGHRERIVVLETIAYLYSSLGYHRKEVYILREVVGCIMDLLVCARAENGLTVASGIMVNGRGSGDSGAVAVKGIERSAGNESVLKLVKYICEVHGIDLEAVGFVNSASGKTPDERSVPQDANTDDLQENPYGWPELQIGIIREALAVAEALPDPPSVAQFSLSALKSLYTALSDDDQYHMYYTANKALTAARRRGETRLIGYWSGRPVVSIELLQPPPSRSLVENPISILAQRPGDASKLSQMTGPFLYNPRKSVTARGSTLVVTDEPLEFVLTLHNPFVFDLEIQDLSLSTSGVAFDTKPISVTIPANSYHPVTLSGKPLEDGLLIVKGCHAQAPGGASREFFLPLATAEEEEFRLRRRSAVACESGRTKYGGLDCRPGKSGKRHSTLVMTSSSRRSIPKFLECTVVPEQPLLRIRWSSLTHGAVMLYNGEKSTLRLTLENISNLPIDFLRLSFDDSTITPAQAALAEGDLSIYDAYETEYQLINRPVFSWNQDQENIEILPGRKVALTLTCTGKVGCTSGSVFISYGYLHRRHSTLSQPPETFHTRQISYPVLVTVYNMLECHNMDILPLRSGDYESDGTPVNKEMLFRDVEEEGWCLFSIYVRNTYGLPFEVTLERMPKDTSPASTSCIVAPGAMTRLVLPLKKVKLAEEITSQAIPMLSDRQFVVDKTKLSLEEYKLQRELFWYREELFKRVRGCWREAGGTRSGELSLRQQRITLPMLDTLRTETVRIQLDLFRRDGETGEGRSPILRKGGTYYPAPYDFIYLRARIANLSFQPLVLMADTAIDPADHVIQEGVLTDIPIGRLESGEVRELETPLCFVACGRFRVQVDTRAVNTATGDAVIGTATLKVAVREDNPR
ncbi:TRAPP II complex [Multifurca ochricompacta]|uniref:TRAPP II complex n=1 Tax=Multifurca ochricompacta TaxID=376703 RepID=A0AAD4QRN0_9AGAM|nr:TRAPP II complex [Multifurca ochricompacta]